MGFHNGHIAHSICPAGTDLPVIRSKDLLEKIEEYIGPTRNFKNILYQLKVMNKRGYAICFCFPRKLLVRWTHGFHLRF